MALKTLRKSFTFSKKPEIIKEIISSTIAQHPDLLSIPLENLESFAKNCIDEIERLHNIPDIVNSPPEDIDVVWAISAPGLLLTKGSKSNWSSNFPWLDNCEREVVGKSIDLIAAVTSKRLNKRISEYASYY